MASIDTEIEDVPDAQPDDRKMPVDSMTNLSISSKTNAAVGDSGFSEEQEESMEIRPTTELNMYYDMSSVPCGQLLIICNVKFDSRLGVKDRTGTEKDIEAMKNVFGKILGFRVTEHQNLTASDMQSAIATNLIPGVFDHKRSSCFAVVIMTHGKDNGLVYGTDGGIQLTKLMEPIKDCEELIGKPKIFIVQACRGSTYDKGVQLMTQDGGHEPDGQSITIPVEADFLYVYSSAPGYVSFQNPTSGSWLISELCRVLEKHYKEEDILTMLTRVCHRLAYCHASKTPSKPETNNLKQISSITSTLTKILKFMA